jgi:hypothetical protein
LDGITDPIDQINVSPGVADGANEAKSGDYEDFCGSLPKQAKSGNLVGSDDLNLQSCWRFPELTDEMAVESHNHGLMSPIEPNSVQLNELAEAKGSNDVKNVNFSETFNEHGISAISEEKQF